MHWLHGKIHFLKSFNHAFHNHSALSCITWTNKNSVLPKTLEIEVCLFALLKASLIWNNYISRLRYPIRVRKYSLMLLKLCNNPTFCKSAVWKRKHRQFFILTLIPFSMASLYLSKSNSQAPWCIMRSKLMTKMTKYVWVCSATTGLMALLVKVYTDIIYRRLVWHHVKRRYWIIFALFNQRYAICYFNRKNLSRRIHSEHVTLILNKAINFDTFGM